MQPSWRWRPSPHGPPVWRPSVRALRCSTVFALDLSDNPGLVGEQPNVSDFWSLTGIEKGPYDGRTYAAFAGTIRSDAHIKEFRAFCKALSQVEVSALRLRKVGLGPQALRIWNSLEPLAGNSALHSLDMSYAKNVRDISVLARCNGLEHLILTGCPVGLAAIDRLKKMLRSATRVVA